MRKGAYRFRIIGAIVASQVLFPTASLAEDAGELKESAKQAGENRWVPSLAITSGVTAQNQDGTADSCLFPGDTGPDSCNSNVDPPLRGFFDGDDLAVSPFVGGALELMTPALPIPTRPRLFVSGEILPTFASDRDLALDGDPGCVRGPESDAGCAKNEPVDEDGNPVRVTPFGEDSARGQGSRTSAQIDTLVYGASLGAAFPLKIGKRQLRIKPSVGWINYKVEFEGSVTNAVCAPSPNNQTQCTDISTVIGVINPSPPPIVIFIPGPVDEGFMQETNLTASASQRFNAIGPGLDIEMDTGRYGPLGVSLFMGGRAYAVLGDRTISFDTEETFTDQISAPGTDRAVGQFEVEVDPWIYRAHVGIRFHWLGNQE